MPHSGLKTVSDSIGLPQYLQNFWSTDEETVDMIDGCWVDSLILKNPAATIIQAITFNTSPSTGIAAATNKIIPAVLKSCSPDFSASMFKDFL